MKNLSNLLITYFFDVFIKKNDSIIDKNDIEIVLEEKGEFIIAFIIIINSKSFLPYNTKNGKLAIKNNSYTLEEFLEEAFDKSFDTFFKDSPKKFTKSNYGSRSSVCNKIINMVLTMSLSEFQKFNYLFFDKFDRILNRQLDISLQNANLENRKNIKEKISNFDKNLAPINNPKIKKNKKNQYNIFDFGDLLNNISKK